MGQKQRCPIAGKRVWRPVSQAQSGRASRHYEYNLDAQASGNRSGNRSLTGDSAINDRGGLSIVPHSLALRARICYRLLVAEAAASQSAFASAIELASAIARTIGSVLLGRTRIHLSSQSSRRPSMVPCLASGNSDFSFS